MHYYSAHTILFKNCLHIESNVFNIFIYPVSTFGLQKKNIPTYFNKSDYLFLTTVTNFGTEFNYFADRIKFILVNNIALL